MMRARAHYLIYRKGREGYAMGAMALYQNGDLRVLCVSFAPSALPKLVGLLPEWGEGQGEGPAS
jgi:hypothetical protein